MESAGTTNVKVTFRSGLLEVPPLERTGGGLHATAPLAVLERARASVELDVRCPPLIIKAEVLVPSHLCAGSSKGH
jgi:hypothetical protein